VADRCIDETADIARASGARVVERTGAATGGKAAALQDGFAAAEPLPWDAAVVLDADSVIAPGFVGAVARALTGDAPAFQARSEAALGAGLLARAMLAAFALQGVALPRGRDRLAVSVRLRGTGMVLRRDVVERFPWPPPGPSEDLRMSLELCLGGVLPRHLDDARLRSANAPTVASATGQRARWEAGRVVAARLFLMGLLRARTRASLEAALHLATPPLALALASLAVGLVAGLVASPALAWVCAAGIGLLGADVAVALIEARVPASTWLALLAAPIYVPWKLWVQLRALTGLRAADRAWAPTPRAGVASVSRSTPAARARPTRGREG
jgi:hypothetical protein